MEGCIPDGLKTAIVIVLLLKKATLLADDFKNYHPVSGLSFISKLVEQVVAKQLLEHIHIHNLYNPYLSAYKTGYLTEAAVLSIRNEVPLSLVIGKHKGVKFHCYADDTQVNIHLSQKNSSAAFKKLNRCLDDIKE